MKHQMRPKLTGADWTLHVVTTCLSAIHSAAKGIIASLLLSSNVVFWRAVLFAASCVEIFSRDRGRLHIPKVVVVAAYLIVMYILDLEPGDFTKGLMHRPKKINVTDRNK